MNLAERYVRPEIPEDLRHAYEGALDRVPRWIGVLVESPKKESNLDHVDGLFNLLDDIQVDYPGLTGVFDLEVVEDMIYVHDGGEIISTDLVRSRPDYDLVKPRHKRKERLGYRFLTKHIEDDELRAKALEVYQRYTDLDPNDPEALFTHLLDKIQAIRFGLKYVYNGIEVRDPALKELASKQALMSADLILEFAIPLRNILSGDARTDLSALVQMELGEYRLNGFPEVARYARSIFLRKLS